MSDWVQTARYIWTTAMATPPKGYVSLSREIVLGLTNALIRADEKRVHKGERIVDREAFNRLKARAERAEEQRGQEAACRMMAEKRQKEAEAALATRTALLETVRALIQSDPGPLAQSVVRHIEDEVLRAK